jgi:cell division protein FtsW (lipid II flippase)
MIAIPTSVWTGLVLLVLVCILIVLIRINTNLKRFTGFQDPDAGELKLHFKDLNGKK